MSEFKTKSLNSVIFVDFLIKNQPKRCFSFFHFQGIKYICISKKLSSKILDCNHQFGGGARQSFSNPLYSFILERSNDLINSYLSYQNFIIISFVTKNLLNDAHILKVYYLLLKHSPLPFTKNQNGITPIRNIMNFTQYILT